MTRYWIFLMAWIVVGQSATAQQTPEEQFQAAVLMEQVEGKLREAIEEYEQVIALRPGSRLSGLARFRMAMCNEKLGSARAIELYRSIVKLHPELPDLVRQARDRLRRLERTSDPREAMIDYYIEEEGLDRFRKISPDRTMEAYTDWLTGNLMVRRRSDGRETKLTDKTWEESPAYVNWKAWSRDGSALAYCWYLGNFTGELRVTSLDGSESRLIMRKEGWSIMPLDWFPGGEKILVKIGRKGGRGDLTEVNEIGSISLKEPLFKSLGRVDFNARGFKVSLDGTRIIFDDMPGTIRQRQLFYLSEQDTQKRLLRYDSANEGEVPIWSRDGNSILFRSRLTGVSLAALDVREGIAGSGPPRILEIDLAARILKNVGLSYEKVEHLIQTHIAEQASDRKEAMEEFADDFSSPSLDTGWSVFAWRGPSIYGFKTFGRFSLKDRPGYLRYTIDPMTNFQTFSSRTNQWSYWHVPSLVIQRTVKGSTWQLEAKGIFSLSQGGDGRGLGLFVDFDPEGDRSFRLVVDRRADWSGENRFAFNFMKQGTSFTEGMEYRFPGEVDTSRSFEAWIRISKYVDRINIEMSPDGETYNDVYNIQIEPAAFGKTQRLGLMGESWFAPAGSSVDWDYIRFRQLPR